MVSTNSKEGDEGRARGDNHQEEEEKEGAALSPTVTDGEVDGLVGLLKANDLADEGSESSEVEIESVPQRVVQSAPMSKAVAKPPYYDGEEEDDLLPTYPSNGADQPWYEGFISAGIPIPLEIEQLKSSRMRACFKAFMTCAAIVCLVTLVVIAYREKRSSKYLAVEKDGGDCEEVLIETIQGDWYVDWDGHWSTSGEFDSTETFLRVTMTEIPAKEYGAALEALAQGFGKIAQAPDRSLMQNLLLAMTYKATYKGSNGGIAQAVIEASASTLLQLTSISVGVTGCPPSEIYLEDQRTETYEMGYRDKFPDFVYANDVVSNNKDGLTTVSWTTDATYVCVNHPLAWSLPYWLDQIIEYGSTTLFRSRATEHDYLTFDWFSVAAATAINNKLIEPQDFMEELDPELFTIHPNEDNRLNSTDNLAESAYYSFMNNGYSEIYEVYDWYEDFRSTDICPDFGDFFGKSPSFDNSQKYDIKYYADSSRKPGMQPIACTYSEDAEIGWVCSVVIGGAHAYPLVWHHIDKCNHCSSESGLSYNTYNSKECIKEKEFREFYGGLFIKPSFQGPFTTHPYPQEDNWISSQSLDTATKTKFTSYELGYSMIVSDRWHYYYAACPVVDWPEVLFLAFNNFEQALPRSIINDEGFINAYEDWHCTSTWVDQAVENLAKLVDESAPIDLDESYLKCKPTAWSAFFSSLGESEGNAQLLLILITVLVTHGVISFLAKRRPDYFQGSVLIREDQIVKTNLRNAAKREYTRRSLSSVRS